MLVLDIVKDTGYNCLPFTSLEPILCCQGYTTEDFDQVLVNFTNQLHNLRLNDKEFRLTEQSRAVYLTEMLEKETRAVTINEDNENDFTANETSTSNINEEAVHQKLKQIKDQAIKRACAKIEATGLFRKKCEPNGPHSQTSPGYWKGNRENCL